MRGLVETSIRGCILFSTQCLKCVVRNHSDETQEQHKPCGEKDTAYLHLPALGETLQPLKEPKKKPSLCFHNQGLFRGRPPKPFIEAVDEDERDHT